MTQDRSYLEARNIKATRDAMHAAVDRCCDAWLTIREDAKCRGYGRGIGYDGTRQGAPRPLDTDRDAGYRPPQSDPTAAAALSPDRPGEWLGQWSRVRAALYGSANRAAALAPQHARVPVEDPEAEEICTFCGLPGGYFVRVDGKPYHKKPDPCYYRRWRAGRGEAS